MKYGTDQSKSRRVSVNYSSNQRHEQFYITMVSEDTHADVKKMMEEMPRFAFLEGKVGRTLLMTKKTKIPE